MKRQRTPTLDIRKVCHQCHEPFRCPTAQIGRFLCSPCLAGPYVAPDDDAA